MFRLIFGVLFMILLIAVIGTVILDQFPSLVPLWEELKMHLATLYDMSVVRYGAGITFLLIIGIAILLGSSKKV